MVQLKGKPLFFQDPDFLEFQFLNGTIKSQHRKLIIHVGIDVSIPKWYN